ncbi:hypothetical protein M513_10760 [Trichuris suis]|uniref:Uncharacterized protein n=1 Tax=Trichuris suis TaxID=68888 RepID=A0A085LTQ2_9BILA|nr:hypothetical protein M513_10760 [Trichuris suis]
MDETIVIVNGFQVQFELSKSALQYLLWCLTDSVSHVSASNLDVMRNLWSVSGGARCCKPHDNIAKPVICVCSIFYRQQLGAVLYSTDNARMRQCDGFSRVRFEDIVDRV